MSGRRRGAAPARDKQAPAADGGPGPATGIFFCAECGEVLSTRDEFKTHQVRQQTHSDPFPQPRQQQERLSWWQRNKCGTAWRKLQPLLLLLLPCGPCAGDRAPGKQPGTE